MTDIEGSSRLLAQRCDEYPDLLAAEVRDAWLLPDEPARNLERPAADYGGPAATDGRPRPARPQPVLREVAAGPARGGGGRGHRSRALFDGVGDANGTSRVLWLHGVLAVLAGRLAEGADMTDDEVVRYALNEQPSAPRSAPAGRRSTEHRRFRPEDV